MSARAESQFEVQRLLTSIDNICLWTAVVTAVEPIGLKSPLCRVPHTGMLADSSYGGLVFSDREGIDQTVMMCAANLTNCD